MSLDSIYQTRGDITNPNLKSVLAKLAVMNTQQLQAFAAQNQDDPIMLSAAQAVHARRAEYAEEKAAQQGGQMPPVNQQVVQGMAPAPQMPPQGMPPQGMPPQGGPLPEEQGIAQLPAPNIQNMAGGGIVAFADGGYTDEDMMSNGEPVLRMADGGHVPRYQGVPTAMGGDGSLVKSSLQNIEEANITALGPLAQQFMQAEQQYIAAAKSGNQQATAQYMQAKEVLRKQLEDAVSSKFGNQAPKVLSQLLSPAPANTSAASTTASATPVTEKPLIIPYGQSKALDVLGDKPPASAPAPGPKPPAPSTKPAAPVANKASEGLEALTSRFTRESDLAQGALRNQRAGLSSLLEQEAVDEAAAVKKRVKDEGDVFAGKEERLAKREQGITGMKNENLGLALLQAGAAIMSTPGNLGEAVGVGVQVGSKSYIAGMDKINAAKEKFADARERLEDLRLNRKDMNAKEIQAADRFIRTARIQGQQLMLDGATNDLKISTDNQRAIFTTAADAIQTDKKVQAQLDSSRITANRPPEQIQIATALGNGNIEAGLRKIAEIQAGKFSVTNSYADYLKAFAGKETLSPPLTFANYAAQFGATLPR